MRRKSSFQTEILLALRAFKINSGCGKGDLTLLIRCRGVLQGENNTFSVSHFLLVRYRVHQK